MTALCLILITLASPLAENYVEAIPRVVSFVIREDGDITHSILLRNKTEETITLDLTYKPLNIDVDGSRSLKPAETTDMHVTLRVPEGTWEEARTIYEEMKEQFRLRRRFPPMTMFSKLAYVVRYSRGEADTLEIPLRLRYDFELEKAQLGNEH